jgi:transcriptional regulator
MRSTKVFSMRKTKRDAAREQRDLPTAHDTIRQSIIHALEGGLQSAKDISGMVGIPEKDVAGHLEHIRTSLHRTGRVFHVQPAACVKCGFLFEKRERLTKPGKCPVCRSGSIHAPSFSIT